MFRQRIRFRIQHRDALFGEWRGQVKPWWSPWWITTHHFGSFSESKAREWLADPWSWHGQFKWTTADEQPNVPPPQRES